MATAIRVLPEAHAALNILVKRYPFVNVNSFVSFVLGTDSIIGILRDNCCITPTPVNIKRAVIIIAACKTFNDAAGNWVAYEPDGREEEDVKDMLLNIYKPVYSCERSLRKSSYIDPDSI